MPDKYDDMVAILISRHQHVPCPETRLNIGVLMLAVLSDLVIICLVLRSCVMLVFSPLPENLQMLPHRPAEHLVQTLDRAESCIFRKVDRRFMCILYLADTTQIIMCSSMVRERILPLLCPIEGF